MLKHNFYYYSSLPLLQKQKNYLIFLPIQDNTNQLFPDEKEYAETISNHVRKNKFTTSRLASHIAMEKLGIQTKSLLPDEKGKISWSSSLAGSISYNKQYALVWIAKKTNGLLSVGIDTEEQDRRFPLKLVNRICHQQEKPIYQNKTEQDLIKLCTWKESCFKALSYLQDTKEVPTWRNTHFQPLSPYEFTLVNASHFLSNKEKNIGYTLPCFFDNIYISFFIVYNNMLDNSLLTY